MCRAPPIASWCWGDPCPVAMGLAAPLPGLEASAVAWLLVPRREPCLVFSWACNPVGPVSSPASLGDLRPLLMGSPCFPLCFNCLDSRSRTPCPDSR